MFIDYEASLVSHTTFLVNPQENTVLSNSRNTSIAFALTAKLTIFPNYLTNNSNPNQLLIKQGLKQIRAPSVVVLNNHSCE